MGGGCGSILCFTSRSANGENREYQVGFLNLGKGEYLGNGGWGTCLVEEEKSLQVGVYLNIDAV